MLHTQLENTSLVPDQYYQFPFALPSRTKGTLLTVTLNKKVKDPAQQHSVHCKIKETNEWHPVLTKASPEKAVLGWHTRILSKDSHSFDSWDDMLHDATIQIQTWSFPLVQNPPYSWPVFITCWGRQITLMTTVCRSTGVLSCWDRYSQPQNWKYRPKYLYCWLNLKGYG